MEKTPQQKVARWYNDRTLFAYHFARSNYVTVIWNWFMGLAGKAAEPFLFATVLYSGYKLLPGVPQPGAMLDAGVFIAQQATLDIGGMGLMKLAQQANQSKDSFAYRVGFILVGLMIANVIVASIERLVPLGPAGTVIEGILLVARAVMAVLYGHAVHSLRDDAAEPAAVVKSSAVFDHLDQFGDLLRAMDESTEQRMQQLEGATEQQMQVVTDHFQTFGRAVAERFQRLEANTDARIAEHLQSLVATMSEHMERTEANTKRRLEQIAADTHDQIQAVTEMVRQLGKSYTYTVQEVVDGLQAEMHTHLQERLAPVIERLEGHHQVLASLPQHLGQIEEATQGQLRIVVQEVTLVKTTLEQQTKAFPELAERLIAAPRPTEHSETNIRKLARVRPVVSVEEEPNTLPTMKANDPPNENDKGAFVRQCLRNNPEIRNADIKRQAEAINLIISPSYISETRKAFFEELSVQNDESASVLPVDADSDTLSA